MLDDWQLRRRLKRQSEVMRKGSIGTLVLLSATAMAAFGLACSGEDATDTKSAASSSDSTFIESVEAAANEAVGMSSTELTVEDEAIVAADTPGETQNAAPTSIGYSQPENIDGVPIKDIDIVAKETNAVATESAEDIVTRELVAWETRLMNIWDSSIGGVVLIQLENTVFPTDGTGAGWFWDDDGHIVTNYHVVQPISAFGAPTVGQSNRIFVETYHGDRFEAEIVGGDHVSDIAVIKINVGSNAYDTLTLGDSADLKPGMATVALGHPFGDGQSFSMTQGIISGLARTIQSQSGVIPIPAVIQTDADMNPGNSGGPLLNSSGEVIGVNTQIRSVSNTNSGVGFATPINLVRRVVDSIIENGTHEYSFIGISSYTLTPSLVERLRLDDDQKGLLVAAVSPDGPAHAAGLLADSGQARPVGDGDIIVRIDNVKIEGLYDLRSYIMLNTSPGDVIVIEVLRDGKVVPLSLTLGSWADRFN